MPATPTAGERLTHGSGPPGPPKARPLWKKRPHRRSPHACDECRLRKRACDAADPCGPCRNSDLNCTYQFRRPIPPPTSRIRDLQEHLRLARSWLKEVQDKVPEVPGLDIDNCLRTLDFTLPEAESPPHSSLASHENGTKPAALRNMLAGCDRLVNAGPGATCFYGAYSELSFILRTLELFEQQPIVSPDQRLQIISNLFDLRYPPQDNSSLGSVASNVSTDTVMTLLDVVFSKNHPMLSFLPEQRIKDIASSLTGPQPLATSDQSKSLLHMTLALGYLFDSPSHRRDGCREALNRGTAQFHIGMAALRPTEANDLTSLQAVLCAIIFLMSTSRIASAHSLIGTACSLALRLGLHSAAGNACVISAEEHQIRIRLLATAMRLDLFMSLILDLPPFLHPDPTLLSYVSQLASEFEAESDFRTAAALRQVSLLAIPLSKRTHGFIRSSGCGIPESVSIKRFEEVRNEFQHWQMDASSLLAYLGSSKEHKMIKHDLEMTYNFGHIILFRPLLHYLRIMADGGSISVTESYHALACIRIASATIVRSHEMMSQGLFLTGIWPSVYTIFLSVMCLIFLIAAHRGTSRPSRAWQRAAVGIRIIAAFKCVEDCSTGCLEVLKMVTKELSHTVYFDFDEIEASVIGNCDRSTGGTTSRVHSPATAGQHGYHEDNPTIDGLSALDTRTSAWLNSDFNIPDHHIDSENQADRMLVQAEELPAEFDFRDMLHLSDEE
ncbi:hypothetical protein F5Y04DRAFT_124020 [Hypomontagnella monticulosa]|nr:hypothetical protein F5Y04DRAFT_124020 [Hypomontagnella monticulosa]